MKKTKPAKRSITKRTTSAKASRPAEDTFDDILAHSDGPNILKSYRRGPTIEMEPLDTGFRPPDDGLTPEQRRMRFLSTCNTYALDSTAKSTIDSAAMRTRAFNGLPSNVATLTRTQPRDVTTGVYVPTIENFIQRVDAIPHGTADDKAAQLLIQQQPWRKACALTPDKKSQPVPTYGPMLLPESRCPVAALEETPAPETRPTHWEPGANPSDILLGIVHDLSNCTSALSARLAVSLGHQPDTEAINNLRALTRSARALQNILHAEEDRRAAKLQQDQESALLKARKPGPGRPRKLRLPEDAPAVTLRVELIQKRKKHGKPKSTIITPEESTPEPFKNTISDFPTDIVTTSTESTPEPAKNKTPENTPENAISPAAPAPSCDRNSTCNSSPLSQSLDHTIPLGNHPMKVHEPGGVDAPSAAVPLKPLPQPQNLTQAPNPHHHTSEFNAPSPLSLYPERTKPTPYHSSTVPLPLHHPTAADEASTPPATLQPRESL